MKIVSCLSLVVLSGASFGCASLHPGDEAAGLTAPTKTLKVSVDASEEYSDATNVFLDFTIENLRDEWIWIEKTELEFEKGDHLNQKIMVGEDLRAWAESYATKKRVSDQNANVGIAGVILAGTAAMLAGAAGGNSGAAAAGGAVVIGATGVGTVRDYQADLRNAEYSKLVPESCLFAPITIPSGGALKRWVIVHVPLKRIARKARLTFKTKSGETFAYEMPVKLSWLHGRH